jgi:hypothetical protein
MHASWFAFSFLQDFQRLVDLSEVRPVRVCYPRFSQIIPGAMIAEGERRHGNVWPDTLWLLVLGQAPPLCRAACTK